MAVEQEQKPAPRTQAAEIITLHPKPPIEIKTAVETGLPTDWPTALAAILLCIAAIAAISFFR